MKYLKFTYVDSFTDIPVSEAPATNGPKFPDVDGLEFSFALQSQYPTNTPTFFGTCPNESITMVPGVIDVLTEVDFLQAQKDEMYARVPKVVTIRQARLALLQAGLLDDIDAAIAASTDRALKIEWEFATEFRRDWAAIISLASVIGLTDKQLDDLFILASNL